MSVKKFDAGQYRVEDTTKSLEETFRQAEEWVEYVLKKNPLVRLNLIGHSLGGLIMLHIARKYPGIVNNLILIASPVLGINGNGPINFAKIQAAKLEAARRLAGGKEEVVDYLTTLWNDEKRKEELHEFSEAFTKKGGQIHIIGSSDDGVVPEESIRLRGAKIHIFSMGKDPGDIFGISGHGRPLTDARSVKVASDAIGLSLAA